MSVTSVEKRMMTDKSGQDIVRELARISGGTSVEEAEAWAVGQRNGQDVPSTDPTYHNNSKYYAGKAEETITKYPRINDQNKDWEVWDPIHSVWVDTGVNAEGMDAEDVNYDSTNKKLTKTIDGSTYDIVSVSTLKTDMNLNNVTNDAQIPKSIGTASGDIIYFTGSGSPTVLPKGTDGQVLKISSGVPAWGSDTNTDENVLQSPSSTESWRKIVLSYPMSTTSSGTELETTNKVYFNNSVSVQPSTSTIRANSYNVNDKVQLQWNATDSCLDFVFL